MPVAVAALHPKPVALQVHVFPPQRGQLAQAHARPQRGEEQHVPAKAMLGDSGQEGLRLLDRPELEVLGVHVRAALLHRTDGVEGGVPPAHRVLEERGQHAQDVVDRLGGQALLPFNAELLHLELLS